VHQFANAIDITSDYDSASDWASPGEAFSFVDVPSVALFAASVTDDGGITFHVIIDEHHPRVLNRVTFAAWPGTECLREIARSYAPIHDVFPARPARSLARPAFVVPDRAEVERTPDLIPPRVCRITIHEPGFRRRGP